MRDGPGPVVRWRVVVLAALSGVVAVAIAVVAVATVSVAAESAAAPAQRYIVTLRAPAGAGADRARQRAAAQASVTAALPTGTGHVERRYASLPVMVLVATAAAADAVRANAAVAAVTPDPRIALPDDVTAPTTAATAPPAALPAVDGSGWTVAVLDTGVDTSHPYLRGRTSAGVDGHGDVGACFAVSSAGGGGGCAGGGTVAFGEAAAQPCTAVIGCAHGTHVAGIALGNGQAFNPPVPNGEAPGAGLYAIKVFSTSSNPADCGSAASVTCAFADGADVLSALDHVLAEAAHYHFAAVNLSLGSPICSDADPAIATAIKAVHDAGIAVVAASGNDGRPTQIGWPACLPGAVAVGSVSPAGTVSGFSDASPQLTLLAPGEQIVSSVPEGGFAAMTGTSMAAPAVAGVFALLRQAAPSASVDQLTATLTSTGTKVPDPRLSPPPSYPELDVAGALAVYGASPPVNGASAARPAGFSPLAVPSRLVDTRSGLGGGRLGAGSTRAIQIGGAAGVPLTGAAAASLNVTAVGAGAAGYLTVFPCGGAAPLVSNVNYAGPAPVANKVVVALGAGGAVCIATMQSTDIVVDIDGWIGASGAFTATGPTRALDTRPSGAAVTDVAVAVVSPGSAGAVVNVTVTQPTGSGFATVYPCGTPPPLASNLNFVAGQTVPGAALVAVDAGGRVCVHTNVPAHVIVDVNGILGAGFTPITPTRVLDTRGGPLVTDVAVHGVPAAALALNVTVTEPSAAGFVTVFPCGTPPPLASNVNFMAGQTVANAVLARPGTGSLVCIHAMVPTHLVVDVDGWVG